jgi:hypothetical protein
MMAMTYADASFDVVLEKGTIDAIMVWQRICICASTTTTKRSTDKPSVDVCVCVCVCVGTDRQSKRQFGRLTMILQTRSIAH